MEESSAPEDGRYRTTKKLILTSVILLGLMFSCLDISIVATALLSISVDLDNNANASWVILGYLLSYLSLAVGFSKASDVFGRRTMCLVAWLFFSGFSIGCALASTMPQLIVFRALQGIGGSGLYSLAQICLVELGPGGPEVIGALIGITLAFSYVLGPILGGLLSTYMTWRTIFWINVPFGLASMLAIILFWEAPVPARLSFSKLLSKVDFLGIFLLFMGSLLLVFGIQEGGSRVWEWSDAPILFSLSVSALSWAALCAWQVLIYRSPGCITEPILPLHLMSRRVYPAGVIVTFITGFVYISLVIIIPEQLQIVYQDTSLLAGVHLLPMLGACALGSFVAGAICKVRNCVGLLLSIGCFLQQMGIELLFWKTRQDANLKNLIGITAIYGFGVGLCFAAATILTTVEARNNDLAVGQGVISQARVLGGAIGLALCTIVFNSQVEKTLSGNPRISSDELTALYRSPMALLAIQDPQTQADARSTYLVAFNTQLLMMTFPCFLALLVSLFAWRCDSPSVVDKIAQHKESPNRASDTELESMESMRVANVQAEPQQQPKE